MVGLFILLRSREHSPLRIFHARLSVRDTSTLRGVSVLSTVAEDIGIGGAPILLSDGEWLAEVEQDSGLLILVPLGAA